MSEGVSEGAEVLGVETDEPLGTDAGAEADAEAGAEVAIAIEDELCESEPLVAIAVAPEEDGIAADEEPADGVAGSVALALGKLFESEGVDPEALALALAPI